MKLEALIDSRKVFDIIAKDSKTAEKRLQIDDFALKQDYENGNLDFNGWVPGADNAADPLTKFKISTLSLLYKIMLTNHFNANILV